MEAKEYNALFTTHDSKDGNFFHYLFEKKGVSKERLKAVLKDEFRYNSI